MATAGTEKVRHHLQTEIVSNVEAGLNDEHYILLASAAACVKIYRSDRLATEKIDPLERAFRQGSFDHKPKLTQVHFGNKHGARLRGCLAQRLLGKWPERYRTE